MPVNESMELDRQQAQEAAKRADANNALLDDFFEHMIRCTDPRCFTCDGSPGDTLFDEAA
jgi:hypothetical protein